MNTPTTLTPSTGNPLWALVRTTLQALPAAVLIGGMAVEAHVESTRETQDWVTVWSHDIDLMTSAADAAQAQCKEEVVKNIRLRKREIKKPQADIDVYVDHEHGLCVPYSEIVANRVEWAGIPIACIGHLIALKSSALLDRAGSGKGIKDADDLARLLLLATPQDHTLSQNWMTPEQREAVARVATDPAIGSRLMGRPGPGAARCRRKLAQTITQYRTMPRGRHPQP